jgi:hypothetical protein
MTSRIVVVFVLIILAPIFVAAQNQPSSAQKRQNTQQASPADPVSVNCNCTTQAENGKNKPQGWHKFVTWPEGIATWALILTLGAIGWQSCETRKAAKAANRSAEAFIRSERAWVIPEVFLMAKKKSGQYFRWVGGGNTVPMEPERILRGEHLQHGLKFINMGRTVAHISAYELHSGFFDHKQETLQIERIDYNEDFDRTLGAGKEMVTDRVVDIHEFVHNPAAEIGPPTWKNWMVVLVSVTYDHVFSDGPEREVFRFVFDINEQVMRRVATRGEDKQQIGKRDVWPKTDNPN